MTFVYFTKHSIADGEGDDFVRPFTTEKAELLEGNKMNESLLTHRVNLLVNRARDLYLGK